MLKESRRTYDLHHHGGVKRLPPETILLLCRFWQILAIFAVFCLFFSFSRVIFVNCIQTIQLQHLLLVIHEAVLVLQEDARPGTSDEDVGCFHIVRHTIQN